MARAADDARRLQWIAAALLAVLLAGGVVAIGARRAGPEGERAGVGELARALDLSGLAIGSGAAYTRHPAQAERFAPWSDHPGAFEHLPSGSLIQPPESWWRRGSRPAERAAERAP